MIFLVMVKLLYWLKFTKYVPKMPILVHIHSANKGKRVGVAYELESGEIIYVPE